MQELMPVLWDDIELARHGTKVAAEHTVTLGFNGRWAELDLADDNHRRLIAYLQPWLNAGRRPAGVVRDTEAGRKMTTGRAYSKRLREFADARGINYTTGSGKWYYSRELRKAYKEHLAASGSGDTPE
jgi:Lsr2